MGLLPNKVRARRIDGGQEERRTMANINVVNLSGAKVGEFELSEVFAQEVNDALLWESVKHYRASLRQGTAATKTRKNVSGAGKKLWKQKGTGRARVGSIRTPLWRGGGTVHGPQPRSYEYAFPQKKLMGALRSAISAKISEGKLTIVDSLEVAEAEDQAVPRGSGQAGGWQDHAAGREQPQAEREAVSRIAQPGGRRAGAQLRGSPLRPAPLRARRFLQGCL